MVPPHAPSLRPPGPAAPVATLAAAPAGIEALRALTVNHRTVGLTALSDAAFTAAEAAALHAHLHGLGIASVVLATCNRTELYWQRRAPSDDARASAAFAAAVGGAAPARALHGGAVAEHLFRVCCGVESLVLGEAEILGQVRGAIEGSPHAGPFLKGVVQAALRTGRSARAETAIGVGAMSVASAAVALLAARLPLPTSRVLVIGAGATGLKVARHLRRLGVGRLVVANRTIEHGVASAEKVGATAVPLHGLAEELVAADAVVGAATSPELLVTADALSRAVTRRAGRPLVVVDLSMPPVIAPIAPPGILRLDLRAIERHVAEQQGKRSAEVPRVAALIARELEFLAAWARQQALRPLMADLRRKIEDIRQAEVARVQAEATDDASIDPQVLDRLSRRLLDRVLALPLASLERGQVLLDPVAADYVRRLFALDAPEGA